MASYATVSTPGLQLIFEITDFSYNNDTIRDAILTRNQKLTRVNLIYRTEPTNCRISKKAFVPKSARSEQLFRQKFDLLWTDHGPIYL